jgi:plasmid replication initiation protein
MPKIASQNVIKNLHLTSSTPLTLADRRLFNYLLHHAFNQLKKRYQFTIPLIELTGVYGTGLPPIDRLKESLRRLIRSIIEYRTETGEWVMTSLLQKAEWNESKQVLIYSYPPDCHYLFTDAFTLERCLIQAHFTQKYSNLLYEMLATAHFSQQHEVIFEIVDLRNQLHVEETKLVNFSDLDRFALMPAINEINSYASFAVKYHTQRKGMKVTHIIFELQNKRNIASLASAQNVVPPKRPRFFIDDPQAERVYAYLLNAETAERRKYFDLACKLAAKKKTKIIEDDFDRPDLWFSWVVDTLINKGRFL